MCDVWICQNEKLAKICCQCFAYFVEVGKIQIVGTSLVYVILGA